MIPQPERLWVKVYELGGRGLDLLFPPRCVNCKRVGALLCGTCLAAIDSPAPPRCRRCGQSLSTPSGICATCRVHPPTTTRILFAAWHEGPAREAIHALKYKGQRHIAPVLAHLLAEQLQRDADAAHAGAFDLITCVPLHPARKAERGYNQAELLARETARLTRRRYLDTLDRVRATADQVGLDPAARRANVQGAFAAAPSRVSGRNVLLVDDVCTTGATLDACATALFQAGARSVFGLTVTRPRGAA